MVAPIPRPRQNPAQHWPREIHLSLDEAAPPRALTVAVFCGSRAGANPAFAEAAAALGEGLARAGIGLVYGGGSKGNMGILADAALAAGGRITGVIPGFLEGQELAHRGLTELLVVESMHARKARMIALSDAIVALPGGLGTMDELIEAITWRSLGLHAKPIYVCNVAGWADGFLAMTRQAERDGFTYRPKSALFEVVPDVASLLRGLSRVGSN